MAAEPIAEMPKPEEFKVQKKRGAGIVNAGLAEKHTTMNKGPTEKKENEDLLGEIEFIESRQEKLSREQSPVKEP